MICLDKFSLILVIQTPQSGTHSDSSSGLELESDSGESTDTSSHTSSAATLGKRSVGNSRNETRTTILGIWYFFAIHILVSSGHKIDSKNQCLSKKSIVRRFICREKIN